MRHVIKTVPFTVTVVLTLALGVASASAALPEWVASKGEVAFTLQTGKVTLTGEDKGQPVVATCENGEMKGDIVSKSPSVKNVKLELKSKCTDNIGGFLTCQEPIVFKELSGTLGYIEDREGGPVGLELKPVTGSTLHESECGGVKSSLSGAFIGEIPAVEPGGTKSQYNSPLTEFLGAYEATGARQDVQTLLTSGGFQTGIHMGGSALWGGGGVSLAAKYVLKPAEKVEIKT